jgi:RNA polymerase sigma-54 factor
MEQKLVMTRQMIQSIEMLQLPLMDLQQSVNQELATNPWLETVEGDPAAETAAMSSQAVAAKEEPPPPSEADARLKRMEALINEWNEPAARGGGSGRYYGENDAKLEAMQNTAAPGISLEEHLRQQLHLAREEPRLKQLAEVIIGSLDEHGYLRIPLMDLFYKAEEGGVRQAVVDDQVTEEDAALALELVQSLDPAGVGARDVKECLLLQMLRSGEDYSFEEKLVGGHLEDLSHNRLPKVAKEMNVTVERIKEGLERIAHLNPHPGRGFGGGRPQYVVPDVIVEELDGEYHIRVNEHTLPPLRVSRESLTLLHKEPKNSAVRDYILGRLGSAVWLMESVIQRRHTLFRIAREIVEFQKPFFEHGPAQLKPLMMQEVAERIGMHVSTVSRAMTSNETERAASPYQNPSSRSGSSSSFTQPEVGSSPSRCDAGSTSTAPRVLRK